MENTFLPSDYKIPDNKGYMKFQPGENTFRVLSSAITGFEYFTTENKPVRSQTPFISTPDIKKDGKVKHFWAFVVYNYNAEKIQILELTQSTLQGAIKAMVDNKKWGDPKGYDITVTKVGDGLDTEYSIMPNPHTALDQNIGAEFMSKTIDLTALYRGDDPFGAKEKTEDIVIDFGEGEVGHYPVN